MEIYRCENWQNVNAICMMSARHRFSLLIIAFLALLGMGICFLEHELEVTNSETKNDNQPREALLFANLVATFLLWVNIVMSYLLWMKYLHITGALLLIDRMPNKMIMMMVFELLINLISPLPLMTNKTYKEYNYKSEDYFEMRFNTILFYIMFLVRMYHFFRIVYYYSDFMSNRAFRITKMYGHDSTFMFACKGLFQRYNIFLSLLLYCFCILYFGIFYR